MNKKLLFGVMSLAALAACTNDDFDSQQQVAEGTSPVQFEVINNDASMRATLGDNDAVVFSAEDGDLFTLYHGATSLGALTGYQNATYKATNDKGTAILTTPSMILKGGAIMVWPADTTFRITSEKNLSVKIPNQQPEDIENYIPYVSDLIEIGEYVKYNKQEKNTYYNTAGKDRKYPVYMRAMGSVLNLKADYAGTDKTIAELYDGGDAGLTGDDAIKEIEVKGVELLTKDATTTPFTTGIKIKFNATPNAAWANVPDNSWKQVTELDISDEGIIEKYAKLTTKKLLDGNQGCKFIMLPQKEMSITAADKTTGVSEGAVVVNTNYGKVIVAPTTFTTNKGKYEDGEIEDAWYRYLTNPSTKKDWETATAIKDAKNRTKVTTNISRGLGMTINQFAKVTSTQPQVEGEMVGAAAERYVKVLLKYLDMSDLHVKTDKELRDAARVWQKMGLDPVTIYLDGDDNNEFAISQKTIEVINEVVNKDKDFAKWFKVQPCTEVDHKACKTIVITGSDYKQEVQDIAFIAANGGTKAAVALADEGTAKPWMWTGTVKVAKAGVNQIVNKGTMENRATATLKTVEFDGSQNSVKLRNEGTWNIKSGTLNVQFDVTNIKEVNISKGAQYRQDGAEATYFTNTAVTLPQRFLKGDAKEMIGVVNNYGVFASVNKGGIVNYGLIEHADKDAKTYILRNQQGGNFNNAFDTSSNRMGRINLPFDNKDEDNISISAAAAEGFVSVTVKADKAPTNGILNAGVVGKRVNYIIVNGGINEIADVSPQVKYIEINDPSKKQPNEIVWSVDNSEYEGLIVLSDVNIKLNTTINVTKAAYLGADMYVGGTLKYKGGAITDNLWKGYYGDTSDNFATKYITY